jgi:His/Glu/Gln/Arg/opine family amino acid ABC transporter permease subunit
MDIGGIYFYFFNVDIMLKVFPALLSGLWVTIKVSMTIIAIGFSLGLILAVIRSLEIKYIGKPINAFIRVYVDLLRASPYLVLVSLVYFALPFIGIQLSTFWATVVSFGACLSAFAEEIFRAGIEAVGRDQKEAAKSLGLTFLQTMRYVILPQAIRISIPTLTNRTVAITKAISMASAIALPDLLKQARSAQALVANPTPLVQAAIMYVILFYPFVRLTLHLEKRMGKES